MCDISRFKKLMKAVKAAVKPRVNAANFDELLLECRLFLTNREEWEESSHRPVWVMEALVAEIMPSLVLA